MPFTHHATRDRFGMSPYRLHWGDVFYPGAQNVVFDWQWPLPGMSVQGQGTVSGKVLRSVSTPQVYIGGNAYVVSGIGGVLSGQLYFQPLSVPNGQ